MKTYFLKTNSPALFVLLLCFVSITGCKKQTDPLQNGGGKTPVDTTHTGGIITQPGGGQTGVGNTTNAGSVYISGYEIDPNTGNDAAEYWKDGVGTRLSDGKNTTRTTGIAVSGTDVYVSGYEFINNISVAKYWKNGIAVTLSDGTLQTQATAVAVSGTDVYVAGYEINAAKFYIAKYWKNGVASTIPYVASTTGAAPFGIAVSGSDVYMTGYVSVDDTNPATHVFYPTSQTMYWKNTDVSVGLVGFAPYRSASGFGIFVDGGDVYVAGSEQDASHTGVSIAEYWKNGSFTQLSDNIYSANAFAIVKSGADVYVAGTHQVKTGQTYANYWKNGLLTNFSDGTNVATADGIAVSGSDVYGVGPEVTDASRGYTTPRCWKNNAIVTLTSGIGGRVGVATGITIAK